jgi:hypothetical protein
MILRQKDGRIQGALWFRASQRDKWNIFSVKHDVAEQVDGMHQGVRRRCPGRDMCRYIGGCERKIAW